MNKYLDRLRECKRRDDRGMMANLQCILVENKRHRAWPALSRLGVPIKARYSSFIAGLYAMHPAETSNGNFGNTCKAIEQRRNESQSTDSKLTATERRFQHVLAAEREEVCDRVLRMARMAKALDVPINYEQLETDLIRWGDKVKTDWASAFWSPGVPTATEEEL
jgi:CRISPR system Cascade subunit CasB